MDNLQLLNERANDSLIQSRCDRRSLATLAIYLFNKGYIISSTSQLIRSIIEELRQTALTAGTDDILSYEDADKILQQFSVKGLNTNQRQMRIYMRQQGKEALFLDGQPIEYAALQPRVTKRIMASKAEAFEHAAQDLLTSGEAYRIADEARNPREFRKNPDAVDTVSSDEPPEHKAARWKEELQDMKSQLAAVPTDIITNLPVQEEDNADEQENEN